MRKAGVIRIVVGIFCALGLMAVYLFQGINVSAMFDFSRSGITAFLINRTVRFLLNDFFMIGVIYSLFGERKYVVFSLWVQLAGFIFFLIPYFILKIQFPAYNGPLISFLHRLILNPLLLICLIPAFYYQRNYHDQRNERPL